jgi:H+-transporting ATPase
VTRNFQMEERLLDGLSETEAQTLLKKYGFNETVEVSANLFWGILKRLWGPIPWMLEAALILELVFGKIVQPIIIGCLLMFSATIGGVQERRAQAALKLLRSHLQVTSWVCRDGNWRIITARELVPGDKLRLRMGDIVPADGTIQQGMVEIDQSAVTGESSSTAQKSGDIIYSGSIVRRGDAIVIVTATGSASYYGQTAELVRKASPVGHLENLLFTVVRYLVAIDAVLATLLFVAVILRKDDVLDLLPFLLVLLTATIPITMPAAFTVANAVEAQTLVKDGVLVTGLSAVQEAATMDVLCVDKTGTLTQNQQAITAIIPFTGESEDNILALAAAACDESIQSPLEQTILATLKERSVRSLDRQKFVPFDASTKHSEAYVCQEDGQILRVALGSPLIVGQLAEKQSDFMNRVEELAALGARVLAVAAGPEGNLTLRGLLSFADTPRKDATRFISTLESLGIRVLMVTGDTLATAKAISHEVGIGDHFGDVTDSLNDPLQYDGFANFYPADKFHLVQTLQRLGKVVGMTGDGINDAPALKQAEVGIAVSSAADVAKASATVVLTTPGLQDMIKVVASGRRVYRRMLTWTITKIARTVELAALLTVGYIATGIFVIPLSLIVYLIVLNDIVTITLATDRAQISPEPEQWNVKRLVKIASVIGGAWIALALIMLWIALEVLHLPTPQIQTLTFAYLIYSAQATIYLTRVQERFWSFLPSLYVALATLGNIILVSVFASLGILMEPVSYTLLLGSCAAVLLTTVLLDEIKIHFFRMKTPDQICSWRMICCPKRSSQYSAV